MFLLTREQKKKKKLPAIFSEYTANPYVIFQNDFNLPESFF